MSIGICNQNSRAILGTGFHSKKLQFILPVHLLVRFAYCHWKIFFLSNLFERIKIRACSLRWVPKNVQIYWCQDWCVHPKYCELVETLSGFKISKAHFFGNHDSVNAFPHCAVVPNWAISIWTKTVFSRLQGLRSEPDIFFSAFLLYLSSLFIWKKWIIFFKWKKWIIFFKCMCLCTYVPNISL
jgi:hypothetical protein